MGSFRSSKQSAHCPILTLTAQIQSPSWIKVNYGSHTKRFRTKRCVVLTRCMKHVNALQDAKVALLCGSTCWPCACHWSELWRLMIDAPKVVSSSWSSTWNICHCLYKKKNPFFIFKKKVFKVFFLLAFPLLILHAILTSMPPSKKRNVNNET